MLNIIYNESGTPYSDFSAKEIGFTMVSDYKYSLETTGSDMNHSYIVSTLNIIQVIQLAVAKQLIPNNHVRICYIDSWYTLAENGQLEGELPDNFNFGYAVSKEIMSEWNRRGGN